MFNLWFKEGFSDSKLVALSGYLLRDLLLSQSFLGYTWLDSGPWVWELE